MLMAHRYEYKKTCWDEMLNIDWIIIINLSVIKEVPIRRRDAFGERVKVLMTTTEMYLEDTDGMYA